VRFRTGRQLAEELRWLGRYETLPRLVVKEESIVPQEYGSRCLSGTMGQISSLVAGRWNVALGAAKESSFRNVVVLITGAGSGKPDPVFPILVTLAAQETDSPLRAGIGQSVAHQFALQGCEKLFLVDLSISGLEKTKSLILNDGLNPKIELHQADIASENSVSGMIEACVQLFARIDVAINNAGIAGSSTRTADQSLEEYCRVCNVNEKGVSRPHYTCSSESQPRLRPLLTALLFPGLPLPAV
jgi:hypothetical protein